MEELDKQLSQMLDEDADDPSGSALGQAIDTVGGDVNLQYRLRRYRLIGESLRNELPPAIDPGFHASVMARITEIEAPARTPAANGSAAPGSFFGWLTRPVAGLAVAAAVAMLTVALWQPLERGGVGDGKDEIAVVKPVQNLGPLQAAVPASAPGMRWKVDDPALQRKLNAYLVNHTEYASSVQGIIPQARVAGYDSGR